MNICLITGFFNASLSTLLSEKRKKLILVRNSNVDRKTIKIEVWNYIIISNTILYQIRLSAYIKNSKRIIHKRSENAILKEGYDISFNFKIRIRFYNLFVLSVFII
ncbi:hypothetical protein BpHYR1_021842 [Brachionus plicatilis]|uniref:Uncharacterized protein n=1 Tax=Brachionus plicatilis TaxID=10195 RepID=A0A3M7T3X5_BRAPC|nr:hypothetical protein BpHYR1_021842 [Brachionus plicatilis]